jgi:non-ribosomal peptide synthetase component F
MITHHSAVAFVSWAREKFGAQELAATLAATSICFDLSVFELFVPLACGGRVVLVRDIAHLPECDAAGHVTLINTVPSAMAELVRAEALPASARTVNLAGEPLPQKLVRDILGTGTVERLWNLYGPTETTISRAATCGDPRSRPRSSSPTPSAPPPAHASTGRATLCATCPTATSSTSAALTGR